MFDHKTSTRKEGGEKERSNRFSQKNHKVYILQYSPSRSKSKSKDHEIKHNTSNNKSISQRIKKELANSSHKTQQQIEHREGETGSHRQHIDNLFNRIGKFKQGVNKQEETGCEKVVKAIQRLWKKKQLNISMEIQLKSYGFEALKQYYFTSSSTNYELFIKSKYDKNVDPYLHNTATLNEPHLDKISEELHSSQNSNQKTPFSQSSSQKLSRQSSNRSNGYSLPMYSAEQIIANSNNIHEDQQILKNENIVTQETLPNNEQQKYEASSKGMVIQNDYQYYSDKNKTPANHKVNVSVNEQQRGTQVISIKSQAQFYHASVRQINNHIIKPPSTVVTQSPIIYKTSIKEVKIGHQEPIKPSQNHQIQEPIVDHNRKKQFFVFNGSKPELQMNSLPLDSKPMSPSKVHNSIVSPTSSQGNSILLKQTKNNSNSNSNSSSRAISKSKQGLPYAIPEQISRQNSKMNEEEPQEMMMRETKKKLFLKDVIKESKEDMAKIKEDSTRKSGKRNNSKILNSNEIAQMMLFGNQPQHPQQHSQQQIMHPPTHEQQHKQQQPPSNNNILIIDDQPTKNPPPKHNPTSNTQYPTNRNPPARPPNQYINNVQPQPIKSTEQQNQLRKRCYSMPKITFTYYPSLEKYQQVVTSIKKIPQQMDQQPAVHKQTSIRQMNHHEGVKLNLNNPGIKPSLKVMYQTYKQQEQTQSTFNPTHQDNTQHKVGQAHDISKKKIIKGLNREPAMSNQFISKQPMQATYSNNINPITSFKNQYYGSTPNNFMVMEKVTSPKGIYLNRDKLISLHGQAKDVEYVGLERNQVQCCIVTDNRKIRSHSSNGKMQFGAFRQMW